MAKSGLPKKYARMGFAKGWKAYKASKRKSRPAARKSKTAARKYPVAKRTATATARRTRNYAPAAKRTTRRIVKQSMSLAQGTALGVSGAVGAAAIIQMLPIVDPRAKALVQLGIGAAAIMLRPRRGQLKKIAPILGYGAMIAGGTSLTKQLAPGLPLISGDQKYSLPPIRRNMAQISAPASYTKQNNKGLNGNISYMGATKNFTPGSGNALMGANFKTGANI